MTRPNIQIPKEFAINGEKADFTQEKIKTGFDKLNPDVFAGDNANKFIDDTYKGLNGVLDLYNGVVLHEMTTTYDNKAVVGKFIENSFKLYHSLVNDNTGHEVTETEYWEEVALGGGGSYIGQTVFSLDPLNEAGLHLYDGTVLNIGGIYDEFINRYIAELYVKAPHRFCTEDEWQASVEQYGVCGKYVYTAGVSVRLPRVTGFVEGTLDINALGEITEAGIPNITGAFNSYSGLGGSNGGNPTGAFYRASTNGTGSMSGGGDTKDRIALDASRASSVYKNDVTTVQPQSIKGYFYVVVATSAKTDIEVDIDNIVTDLNAKVDVSNMVEMPTIVETSDPSLMPSYYIVYSNGWGEQGGQVSRSGTSQVVALVKEMKYPNYQALATREGNLVSAAADMVGDKTTTSFTMYGGGNAVTNWQVSGYIK